MKRSEMLKIIEMANNGDYLKSAEENILDAMEKAGILPPISMCNAILDTSSTEFNKPIIWERVWDEEV